MAAEQALELAIDRIRALRGPNLWTRQTALEILVRCCDSGAARRASLSQAFESRIRALFPAIGEHWASHLVKPGPASLAEVLEIATLALQAAAGCPVSFSRTQATVEKGVYQVVVEYTEESVGRKAVEHAQALIDAARQNLAFDAEAAIAELRAIDEDVRLGPSTRSIVDAGVARNIPWRRLTDGSLVQFGWGHKQRRIWAAEVDSTSAVSEAIAQDKDLTKDRKSTRLNSSHRYISRMPSSA
jgi:cyanophycin synthetase